MPLLTVLNSARNKLRLASRLASFSGVASITLSPRARTTAMRSAAKEDATMDRQTANGTQDLELPREVPSDKHTRQTEGTIHMNRANIGYKMLLRSIRSAFNSLIYGRV